MSSGDGSLLQSQPRAQAQPRQLLSPPRTNSASASVEPEGDDEIPAGAAVLEKAADGLFHCTECSMTFQWISHMVVHMRSHTGERPYQCHICKKTFAQQHHLQEHMRIENGLRDFQCTICGKDFTHKHHLTVHMRLHTGERPYVCMTCGYAFTQSNNLQRHYRSANNACA